MKVQHADSISLKEIKVSNVCIANFVLDKVRLKFNLPPVKEKLFNTIID